ncbi:MAG: LPS export ABC transporter permease LptG [Candidatus Omnitrophica bacterium]|nr:LPS export ABC transporter permease LptG [Candidatus Omnitrophota bacterium]
MRILDRYLIKHLVIPIVICSLTLIFLIVIADLFDHLSDLIKNKTSFAHIFQYYIHLMPIAFVQTVPWAAFLGAIFLLVNFNSHNEILAMKVAGLSISSIILPIFYVGFLVGLVSFLVNDRLVPATFRKAQDILEEKIEQSSESAPGKRASTQNFTYFSLKNRLYYAKEFDTQTNRMQGMILLFFDEKKRVRRRVFANAAVWDGSRWKLENVTDYETNAQGKILGEPRVHAEIAFPEMEETPKELAKAMSESALLSYRELKHYIRQMEDNNLQAYPEKVELHYKLAAPWHSLVMMTVGILFLTVTRKKKVIAVNVLYCLGLVFLFYVMGAMSLAMGKVGTLPPFVSAWSNTILFSIGSFFFLDRAND